MGEDVALHERALRQNHIGWGSNFTLLDRAVDPNAGVAFECAAEAGTAPDLHFDPVWFGANGACKHGILLGQHQV